VESDGNPLPHREVIPLSSKFSKDDELRYFICTAFGDFKNARAEESLLQEILVALRELRRLGLP
jgi:hypothetical protein